MLFFKIFICGIKIGLSELNTHSGLIGNKEIYKGEIFEILQ
jgi:hypothetical protein